MANLAERGWFTKSLPPTKYNWISAVLLLIVPKSEILGCFVNNGYNGIFSIATDAGFQDFFHRQYKSFSCSYNFHQVWRWIVNEFGAKKSCKRTHELKSRGSGHSNARPCVPKNQLWRITRFINLDGFFWSKHCKETTTHTQTHSYSLNLSQQKSSPNHPSIHPQKKTS